MKRKILTLISLIFGGFVILIIIALVFAPPTFTLTNKQLTSATGSVRISGHATDKNSQILIISDGQTIAKITPDQQSKDFYYDLTSLAPGNYSYSLIACSTVKKDRCSSRQEISVLITSTQPSPTPPAFTPTVTPSDLIKITNVIDGDTVKLQTGQIVRLIGIDTPEIGNQSDCYGQEASQKANQLLLNKLVRLEKDISETDRYQRLLRYLWIGDELINETLVKTGFAKSASYPPDVKYQDRFRIAESQARIANLGLWASCLTPSPKSQVPQPTIVVTPPVVSNQNTGSYSCNCSKTCTNLSCAEAQYQLTTCGCSARDADGDGTACDANCQ